MSGLEAVVESRKAIVRELQMQLADLKRREAEERERARPLFRAKRDLETHQKMRDVIYLRLLEEQANQASKE